MCLCGRTISFELNDLCRLNLTQLHTLTPYSLPSVGPVADPGVQAVIPQVTLNHPPGGRLPLLFVRPAVTFPAEVLYQIIPIGDRGTCVRADCPRQLPGSGPAEIRTGDLLGCERTLYRYATQAFLTPCRPKSSQSVMHGQCDLKPTVTFPAVVFHFFRDH